jgi:hypothetical protein
MLNRVFHDRDVNEIFRKSMLRTNTKANNSFRRWKKRIIKHLEDSEPVMKVSGSCGSDAHVDVKEYPGLDY